MPEFPPLPFEKRVLSNGMTLILHQDRRLPLVGVNLWYRVGAKDEPPKRSGFAHLFEHLMFMGTRRAPQGEFDRIMEEGGGQNNATTSEDRTDYFSYGPSELLPTLLWLEADRLEDLGVAMTVQKLDLQRDVVRNERRQSYENEPYGPAELELNGLLYPPGHPYAIPVIGTHEDLAAATVDDVRAFFDVFYSPNNLSLVVAGDFERDETIARVEDLFGTLPRKPEPPRRTAARPNEAYVKERVLFDANAEFPRTSYVWHSPALFEPGDAECDVAAKILGDGTASRLHRRLMVNELLAQSVGVYQASMKLSSIFRIDVAAADGVPLETIERALDDELAAFFDEGPEDEDLGRVVAQAETDATTALQRVMERAERFNVYEDAFGDPDGFARDLDRYREVDRGGVRAVAREILDPKARLVLRTLPTDGPENGDAS
jgi:zinc protease